MKKNENNNAARECRKSFPERGRGKGKTVWPAFWRAGFHAGRIGIGNADGVEPVPPKAALWFSGGPTSVSAGFVAGSDDGWVWLKARVGMKAKNANMVRMVLAAGIWFAGAGLAGAATHSHPSGRVEVDTRTISTYMISGRLLMGGNPVANAEVILENTAYKAVSDAAGYFAITNVPPGQKYTLVAAVQGAEFLRQTGVDVVNAAVNLGNLLMNVLTGPYKLVPLSPDVNPAVSEVETDGVLFRHYQVLTQNGNLPAPLATFTVQREDGTAVPQLNAAEASAGFGAGTADWTGVLSVRVPGDYLTVGSNRRFDILEGTTVRASFYAKARPIEYDRIWKAKAGASIKGMYSGVALGLGAGGESEITESVVEGQGVVAQQIEYATSGELKLGLEASQGVSMTGPYYEAGVGAKVVGKVGKTYRFDPNTTDVMENALKFYAVTAPLYKLAMSGQPALLIFVEQNVEPGLMGPRLVSVQGEMGVGGYATVKGNLGVKGTGSSVLGVAANLSAEALAMGGGKYIYWPANEAGFEAWLGCRASATLSVGAGAFLGSEPFIVVLGNDGFAGVGLRGGFSAEGKASLYVDSRGLRKVSMGSELELSGGAWGGLKLFGFSSGLSGDAVVGLGTEIVYDLRGKNAPAFWADLQAGKVPVDAQLLGRATSAIGQSLLSDWAAGEMKLYLGLRGSTEIDLSGSATAASVGVGVSGELEKGVERTILRNRILRLRSYPLELYPGDLRHLSADMPTLQQKLAGYAGAAGQLFAQALNQTVQTIQAGVGTTLQVVGGAVDFVGGTIAGGTQVIGSILSGGATGGGTTRMGLRSLGGDVLPPTGASNYVYGVGGIVSFASSNELTGAATLRMSYTDDQIAGLDEATLRIYRFNNASADWTLIGGTVNAESNVVTASITELGTFALAPPMPKGPLMWSLSADELAADGASVVTVRVSNITLNTGESATNAWLFTVLENGATVLNEDGDTNAPGVQVVSSNATLEIEVQAPSGGTEASIRIFCAAGGAAATVAIPLVDDGAPDAPSGLALAAGQSRVFVSWASNASPDAVSHRVYYRKGEAGPPYDGVAAVEGQVSPASFPATALNAVLRGLDSDSTYFVAVSAMDGSGNESELMPAGFVTTSEQPPMPPTGVAATFGEDGKNFLMWALSEDDGFNDRDVVRYEVYRAILQGGGFQKVGETPAGVGVFVEPEVAVALNQYVRYAVKAVDANEVSSDEIPSLRVMPGNWGVDNDWDGLDDEWELRNGLDPLNRLDADLDDDGDGYSNRKEYEAGTDPQDKYSYFAIHEAQDSDEGFALKWESVPNRVYTIDRSTNLPSGFERLESGLPASPPQNRWPLPTVSTQSFYRIGVRRQ